MGWQKTFNACFGLGYVEKPATHEKSNWLGFTKTDKRGQPKRFVTVKGTGFFASSKEVEVSSGVSHVIDQVAKRAKGRDVHVEHVPHHGTQLTWKQGRETHIMMVDTRTGAELSHETKG